MRPSAPKRVCLSWHTSGHFIVVLVFTGCATFPSQKFERRNIKNTAKGKNPLGCYTIHAPLIFLNLLKSHAHSLRNGALTQVSFLPEGPESVAERPVKDSGVSVSFLVRCHGALHTDFPKIGHVHKTGHRTPSPQPYRGTALFSFWGIDGFYRFCVPRPSRIAAPTKPTIMDATKVTRTRSSELMFIFNPSTMLFCAILLQFIFIPTGCQTFCAK